MRHPASHPATFAQPAAKQEQDRIFWFEHNRSGQQMEYMRNSGKAFRHGAALLALVPLLVAAMPVSAQVLD